MLTFFFGLMGSGKSALALMTAFEKDKPNAGSHPNRGVLATTIDRSLDSVTSRTGMAASALTVAPGSVTASSFAGFDTVVIDEAQFLTAADVEVLAEMAAAGVEVICFGLKTDFSSHMFPGSARLIELAERVEPVAITPRCALCNRPAVINARLVAGRVTDVGETVIIGDVGEAGDHTSYDPMCYRCWRARLASDH